MGARPIAILDSLRFGPIDNGKTRHIVDQVTAADCGIWKLYWNSDGWWRSSL